MYGKCAPNIFLECVKSLGQLRDTYDHAFVNELEMTIGTAIKYIGPENIISDTVIPLKVSHFYYTLFQKRIYRVFTGLCHINTSVLPPAARYTAY